MKTIKNIWSFLIGSKFGWVILGFIWMAIFLTIDNIFDADWAFYTGMIGVAFNFVMTIIFIIYAWIINPIREYKERKKNNLQK